MRHHHQHRKHVGISSKRAQHDICGQPALLWPADQSNKCVRCHRGQQRRQRIVAGLLRVAQQKRVHRKQQPRRQPDPRPEQLPTKQGQRRHRPGREDERWRAQHRFAIAKSRPELQDHIGKPVHPLFLGYHPPEGSPVQSDNPGRVTLIQPEAVASQKQDAQWRDKQRFCSDDLPEVTGAGPSDAGHRGCPSIGQPYPISRGSNGLQSGVCAAPNRLRLREYLRRRRPLPARDANEPSFYLRVEGLRTSDTRNRVKDRVFLPHKYPADTAPRPI